MRERPQADALPFFYAQVQQHIAALAVEIAALEAQIATLQRQLTRRTSQREHLQRWSTAEETHLTEES